MSAVASVVSLLAKDSVLAFTRFLHDYKLAVEVTDYAIDRLVASIKHAAVNVIRYIFSTLEGGIEQITSYFVEVFRT